MNGNKIHREIEKFISNFAGSEGTFLNGCCYWFAWILERRFQDEDPRIQYEPVDGHFVTKIGDRLYDIRGDVTALYGDDETMEDLLWDIWSEDRKWYDRLMRDCRDFLPPEGE